MADFVPKIVSISKEVFWKSIDALLAFLAWTGGGAGRGLTVAKWAVRGGAGYISAAYRGLRAARAAGIRGKIQAIEVSLGGVRNSISALKSIRGTNTLLKISDAAGKLKAVRIAYNEHKRLQHFGSGFQHAGMMYSSVLDLDAMRQRIVNFFDAGEAREEEEIFPDFDSESILQNTVERDFGTESRLENGQVSITGENFNSLLVSFFVESSTPAMDAFSAYMESRVKKAPVFAAMFGRENILEVLQKRAEETRRKAVMAAEQLHGETKRTRHLKYAFTWNAQNRTEGIRIEFVNGAERQEVELAPNDYSGRVVLHNAEHSREIAEMLQSIENICNAAVKGARA